MVGKPTLIGILILFLSGCVAQLVRVPVPVSLVESAQIKNMPNVRYWGDALPKNINEELELSFEQTRANRPELFRNGRRKRASFLAISGGGGDGAFGAGLLKGWSAAGTRPEFDLVTGISTGALAAPFVFLGPEYDRQLEEMYTLYSTDDLVQPQILSGLLGGSAIADSSKLAKILAGYVNHKLLAAVAREHDRGRRLLIGTTNLDAERPVVWNMGRIAKLRNKQALLLFRKVLLASASIPAAFPPVVINVSADGRTLQELHVDGGTTGQVFFLPPQLLIDAALSKKRRSRRGKEKLDLYIIMNTSLSAKWHATQPTTAKIASRSLSTIIKQQAISDLYKLYVETKQNGIRYNLASIPDSFKLESKEVFDRAYMNALFKVGFNLGQQGYKWTKRPPGLRAAAR